LTSIRKIIAARFLTAMMIFDHALLRDARNHLDDAANIPDNYEGGQLDPTIVDQLPAYLVSDHTSLPHRIYHTE
jgi:hypothetical protein